MRDRRHRERGHKDVQATLRRPGFTVGRETPSFPLSKKACGIGSDQKHLLPSLIFPFSRHSDPRTPNLLQIIPSLKAVQ